MRDNQGRLYAKATDVKVGDKLVSDDGFTCMDDGSAHEDRYSDGLYVSCEDGEHYLCGQIERGYYVGLYPA